MGSLDNVYIMGETNSFGEGVTDLFLVKYDSSGVKQWNITWGGTNLESGFEVAVDSSNNVYIVGRTASYGAGGYDILLLKYSVEISKKEQGISGYPLILIIRVICVITAISLMKKYDN